MLEFIRSSAQSFGVKIAFGIIILVFVFWGVGNFNDRDYSNVVAVVNGEPIVATEFEKAYQNAEEYLLRADPGLTREQLAKDHLGRQVLKDMIQELVLAQEASKAGITISPLELRQAVGKIKAFQNENGKFDPEVYKRALAARRLSPAAYEKELSGQLLREKMFNLLTAAAWVDAREARNLFNYLQERRTVDYYFIPAASSLDNVKVTDAEMRAWYDQNKNKFEIPRKTEIEYIIVRPEELVKREDISDEQARTWYENNAKNFSVPEKVKASHILVPVAADADDTALNTAREQLQNIKKRLDAGESFAAIADEVNIAGAAGPGGELGWIGRGETVPEFEEAVFAMQRGSVSGEVRTPFGLHLIYLQDRQEPGVKSFDEVKEEIYKGIAFEEGMDKLHDTLDNLVEDNILNKPMPESASRYGLNAEKSKPLDKNEIIKLLGVKDEGADAIMATESGLPLDMALEAADQYVVARVVQAIPAGTEPYENVKETIEKTLRDEQALHLTMNEAQKLLDTFRQEPFDKVSKEYRLQESAPLNRAGTLADFAPNQDLINAIFEAKADTWLSRPFDESNASGEGALLVHVGKILPPTDEDFTEVQELLLSSARQNRAQAIFEFFMNGAMDKAKIEITNQNLIDRIRG